MAEVKIPIQTKYDGAGFRQLQQDTAKLRRLQERHNRAVLQETRQQISEQRRLANLNRKLERDLAKEAAAHQKVIEQNNKSLQQWGQATLVAGAAVGAFVVESVKMSEEAAATERSFIGLSGGAAEAAANLAAMGRATRDLVTEQEQERIANQLLGMGLVSNAQEIETLVGGARRLGKEFKGLGAADAANEFALLLSNMSYLRLDQFGLSAGKVRERVNELKESGMGAEEAFKTAVFEEMQASLSRLGPEVETNTERVQGLAAGWSDFQVKFGGAVTAIGDGSGAFDQLEGFLDKLGAGADAWAGVGEQAKLLQRGMEILNQEGETTIGWMEEIPIIGNAIRGADFWGSQVLRLEDLQEAMVQAGQEMEAQNRAQEEAAAAAAEATRALQAESDATTDATDATKDNTKALEEQARRMEQASRIRHDAARELLDIEENAANDVADVWSDYWDDQESEWQAHNKRLANLQKRAAAEAKKDDKDLAKSLKKIGQDADKQITKLQKDAAKEQKNEAKRRQVDVLADERLFNFELQQLAAEGQGNAIREAIERRAIEEQIAKEKAAVETQIEADQRQEQIQTIRDTAAERRTQLQQDHAEEAALRDERLSQETADEEEQYAERMLQLRAYREEKLVEVEAAKQEAIAKLAEELAETGDLTKSELEALAPVAGELGEAAGKSFADGLTKGFETNQRINELLAGAGLAGSAMTGTPRTQRGAGIPRFQFGGTVPGPIGAPVPIIAHGGETVGLPPISLAVNVAPQAAGMDPATVERITRPLFQQFVDDVLVPALS